MPVIATEVYDAPDYSNVPSYNPADHLDVLIYAKLVTIQALIGDLTAPAMGSMNERLEAIQAELEEKLETADLALEAITRRLEVKAVSCALPANAAIATNQATVIAAMLNRAATPVVYNVTMTTANTEYSQALPANTKKFLVKCRGAYDIKLCFTALASGTTYITVPAALSYWEDLIQPSTITLYFQCATAAQVAEIVAWS